MTRTEPWFDGFYEQHRSRVLAYCARRTDRATADDAVSEVFTIAWRRRDDIPGGDRALPWLYGVARRVLSQQRRSSRRALRLAARVAAFPDPPPPDPEGVVVQRQEYSQVRTAVAQLRPADREVLLLSAWEGLSHSQISAILECSPAAVGKRLARAKQRLAKQYETQSQINTHRPPASAAGGGGSR